MRQFVIFSEEEIAKLRIGKPVKDKVNRVTYLSEAAYERYLKGDNEDDQMP